MELTNLEKTLYNKHLIVSRTERNKPFKLKQTFADIEDTDKHKFLKRISILFCKHPEINPDIFFKAPYKLYPDVAYFGLDYFSTMRAVRAYTTYKKTLLLQDPDSQLDEVKESLKFIANFCIENKIYLHQYPLHQTAEAYTWMKHYKENKINIYSVMEFPNIFSMTKSLADDVQKFYVGEFLERFQNLYLSYNNSNNLKSYVQKAHVVLSEFVQKQLTSSTKPLSY